MAYCTMCLKVLEAFVKLPCHDMAHPALQVAIWPRQSKLQVTSTQPPLCSGWDLFRNLKIEFC